ncbi:MAG: histidine triad nucleotide-binding protein [Candidatus Omnitrophica bacterium 4484_49]|nr:histidine triad nucleotide-binding protein [Candidatus Omnitrophota bacterium]OQX83983.1 MAG: histidine triad nucleotide-binding protein [Candidatus Omnitrophica bacterium 4484_49]RKY35879.1 MAG: histidine triad nucleotide-binding protein [Candidatus Omnitrophota bacterium]
MSEKCIFCKIADKEISSSIVYEDPEIVAFNDINPQAPVHIIIIPRKHIPRVMDLEENDAALIGKLFIVAKKLAKEKEIEDGYRLVINCNPGAGQSVFHIHLHLLGGRKFTWPPG